MTNNGYKGQEVNTICVLQCVSLFQRLSPVPQSAESTLDSGDPRFFIPKWVQNNFYQLESLKYRGKYQNFIEVLVFIPN